ncbi:uncharacterized protein LOC134772651 [Penaeus indicus]|uniref:uncharacterized protein LOC134772651 n=1 Tax=Penaeus indicus TaxID=29960 RepID=UPI00300CDD18
MSGDNFSPQGTTKRQRKDGGIRCAAWGCGKSKLKDNIGVFEFPDRERSPDRFRFWCSLVSRTRKDFRFSKGTSRLCADHFDSDQIENWMRIKLMEEEDPVAARKIPWRLIPHARPNPSLFPRPGHGSTPQPKQPQSMGNSVEPTRRPWPRETTSEDMEITKGPRRGAAAIRERKRLVEDAQTDMVQKDLEMMAQQDAISDMMDIYVREVAEGHGLETGKSKVTHRDIHIQVNRRPTHRSTRVQICPKTFSQEISVYQYQFAPKMFHFHHGGMASRLHYNENGNKEQAVTQSGVDRLQVIFPKVKKGGYSVRCIKKSSTYNYVNKLLQEIQHRCIAGIKNTTKRRHATLCQKYQHPEKVTAVQQYIEKFNRFPNK